MNEPEIYPTLCRVCHKATYPDPDQEVCDKCRSRQEAAQEEEYAGRQRLSDWQHENRVNDNIRKMDNYR